MSEVDDLELDVRIVNMLHKRGIETIEEFMQLSESQVMLWQRAGRKTWRQIEETQQWLRELPFPAEGETTKD